MIQINCHGKTDVGIKRSNNEDALVVKPDLYFLAVADGMGGVSSGEVASQIFIDTTLEVFSNKRVQTEEDAFGLIQESFILANDRVLGQAMDNPERHGMGSTGELIVFYQQHFMIGHVGDSRVYKLRQEELKQITRDHSFVQDQIDRGILTPESAKTHPHRNVILRAVGVNKELAVDIIKGECLPGDIFLLCSDGLTGMVDDATIENILLTSAHLSEKVENLIGLANSAGGKDNITVALCEVLQ